jgi:hypothetical protein
MNGLPRVGSVTAAITLLHLSPFVHAKPVAMEHTGHMKTLNR